MTRPPYQMPLPLRPALGRADFYVAPPNAMAIAMIDGWRDWPGHKLMLVGPAGSGKTHLAHIWAQDSGAQIVYAGDLPDVDVSNLAQGSVCVEDVCAVVGDSAAERVLFHLHNLCLAEGHSLLVTAKTTPRDWPMVLPDLASRMLATPVVQITDPDDALLAAVLVKQFADRQTVPAPDVIPYLVSVMPRSLSMAQHIVAQLDAEAMGTRSGVTRAKATAIVKAIGRHD